MSFVVCIGHFEEKWKTVMLVYVRVDSSEYMGTGHVMRCLALTDKLRETRNADVKFICRQLAGNMASYIKQRGYVVHLLPPPALEEFDEIGLSQSQSVFLGVPWRVDAEEVKIFLDEEPVCVDLLIVDNYAIDGEWESLMRSAVREIMVIDDLADRSHNCDILLDQNLYDDMFSRYDHRVPEACRKFLGPQYVLLRPEFYEARRNLHDRHGAVKRIIVFFGGTDPTNETVKTLEAIALINRQEFAIDVVVGAGNPFKSQVEKLCKELPQTSFYCQVSNMAELMRHADLAIGAGGSTSWERCYLGLPAVVIVTAENQEKTTTVIARKGAIDYIGKSSEVSKEIICDAIQRVVADRAHLKSMSQRALEIMKDHDETWVGTRLV